MAPKDLKKGQKQIDKENAGSLQFYIYIILGISAFYVVVSFAFFELRWSTYLGFFMPLFVYAGSYKFLSSIVLGGMDLAMEGGMAEHAKDLILVTAIIQLLSLVSNYFWFLWLVVPGRAFYMLWVNVLSPWFFAAPPPEMDEKQQKKYEKKMKRQVIYK
uniref:Transmembrane protein 208 n=1 Tax=Hydra vulgaris TaxID=6087 RepID=T2M6J9_HYDVU